MIEHESPRSCYILPVQPEPKPAEPETRFELARVVRVNREGLISHACRPYL